MQISYILKMDLRRVPQVVLFLHEFFHLHFALCPSKIRHLLLSVDRVLLFHIQKKTSISKKSLPPPN